MVEEESSQPTEIVQAVRNITPMRMLPTNERSIRLQQLNEVQEIEIKNLKSQLGAVTKKLYKLETENRQQRSVMAGVLEGTSGEKKAVIQMFLPIYMAEGAIEKALKHFGGGSSVEKWLPWIIGGIIAALFIGYLWYHPEVIAAIQQSVSSSIVIAGLVVFGVAIFYIALRLRRRSR